MGVRRSAGPEVLRSRGPELRSTEANESVNEEVIMCRYLPTIGQIQKPDFFRFLCSSIVSLMSMALIVLRHEYE